MNRLRTLAFSALLAAAGSAALCRAEGALEIRADTSLTLDLARALSEPPADAPPGDGKAKVDPLHPEAYGRAGSRWWTIGGAWANDFSNNNDFNIHGAFSQFLGDGLEFALEVGAWYFNQEGPDTGGLSASMIFRWHFWHADDYKWTVFGDAGIGILGSFADVPDGGTSFNFLPRIGIGYTRAFNDSIDGQSRGPRWMVGVRYHHISNGRINSDDNNPSRDSVCVYGALTIPF